MLLENSITIVMIKVFSHFFLNMPYSMRDFNERKRKMFIAEGQRTFIVLQRNKTTKPDYTNKQFQQQYSSLKINFQELTKVTKCPIRC